MPLQIRRHPINPRGRHLDPKRPLFVTRRIPIGTDDNGVAQHLVPGSVYDPAGVPPLRVAALFRGRFIGHDLPRGVNPIPAAKNQAEPEETAEAAPPPPAKPKRPRAGV